MATAPRSRLELLECGRGLAAFAVVLFHANASSQLEGWRNYPWFTVFQYGVDFFFILSGFIIYVAHSRDFGERDRLATYAKKRAIRLLPTLWLVTGLTYGLQLLLLMRVDLATFLRSALPYPSLLPTDPAVVWTLRHEFLFYIVIGITIFSRRTGLTLFALWMAACVLQLLAMLGDDQLSGVLSLIFSSYSLDFGMGMAIAALHARRSFSPSFAPLAIGIVLLVLAFAWQFQYGAQRMGPTDYSTPGAAWFTLVLGAIFTVIVHGLVVLDARVAAPRYLVSLGGATYALYLVHAPINGLMLKVLPSGSALLASGVGAVILVVAGTAGGLLLHVLVEQPSSDWLRRRFLRRSPTKIDFNERAAVSAAEPHRLGKFE